MLGPRTVKRPWRSSRPSRAPLSTPPPRSRRPPQAPAEDQLLTREQLQQIHAEALQERDRKLRDLIATIMREHAAAPSSVAQGLRNLARDGDRGRKDIAVVGCTVPKGLEASILPADHALMWAQLAVAMSELYSRLIPGSACRIDAYERRITVHVTL